LNQAFDGGRRVAKCPCTICRNYSFLTQDEVQVHLCQEGFIPNYQLWRDHGEVEPLVIDAELNRNEDDDRMNEMVADIGREYEVGSGEQGQPLEVQNFYMLLGATDEKVRDGSDMMSTWKEMRKMMSIKKKSKNTKIPRYLTGQDSQN
jgi:hypothetical protein